MDDKAADTLIEARAHLDGVLSLLAEQTGTISIDAFSLEQLLRPACERMDKALDLLQEDAGEKRLQSVG